MGTKEMKRRDVLETGAAGTVVKTLLETAAKWVKVGVMLLLLALAGCSMEPPGKSDKAAGGETTGKTTPGKIKLAGIGFQDDQFFKLVELGMKDAATKANAEILLGNSAGSADKETTLLEGYVTQNVNAIVIAPFNPKTSIPALQKVNDKGIKVVTFDSAIDADFPLSNIKTDRVALGRSTGEEARRYIQEKMGGKAKVAIISYLALNAEAAGERNRGFEEEMKKLPGVQIVARQDGWIASDAEPVVSQVLTAHPDVNLIWSANEGGTVGSVNAVKNAGKAGKVVVFGTDISEQMCDFLLADDNILQAVTGQKPFEIGTQAVNTALKALKGETVEKKVTLPGQLYTRRQPDEVKKYKAYLQSLPK